MEFPFLFLVTAISLLTGCNQSTESDSVSGGDETIEVINYTHQAINRFSVNRQFDVSIIGPWQGGGGVGYLGVPPKQEPGMTIKIEWGIGEASTDGFPGYDHWDEYLEWGKKAKASYIEHTAMVPMPGYNGQKICGIEVHPLSYDRVKMTTSCYDYGSLGYPIKDPIKIEEPKVCPEQIQGCQGRVDALYTWPGSEPVFPHYPSMKAC